MSDDSSGPRGDGPNRRNQEPQFNWKGFILFLAAAGLLLSAFMASKAQTGTNELTYPEFKQKAEKGLIFTDEKHPLKLERQSTSLAEMIRGYYIATGKPPAAGGKVSDADLQGFYVSVNLDYQKEELRALMDKTGLVLTPDYINTELSGLLINLLPVVLIFALLFFIIRQQIKSAGRGAMGFGKSKAKLLNHDRNKVTFKDVAGVEEAKDEVQELVEFLRDPKKFQRLGGKIPKGVLMVGSPGTGKTLLAKAIAGEADVPFFSISGSDFVEMFVGVGASRVRDMFEQGRKNAPCIVFIDEIDAVGRHRGHGMGGGHDEREQTLNALLVEMDGFEAQEGIIIIAATNRADVLDPALLRPGRFDRQVTVSLPDVKGRDEILKVHAKKVKLSEDADMHKIARGTPGFSGAELANLINEAALLAARRNLKSIGTAELEEARDKVRWGRERRSMALTDKDKEKTAYHEAGHAILIEVLENTDPLHKVTIIPRGPSLGSTMWLPEEDKFTDRKDELLDQLIVAMGGRVAEEIKFNNVASGASGDIQMATSTARKMVCSWGMSEKLGMVRYGYDQMEMRPTYSEATARLIDEEIKQLIDNAYAKAKELLLKHRAQLDAIALALLEYETLDGEHIKDLMTKGYMDNPPDHTPTKPSAPPPIPVTPSTRPARVGPEEDLGGMTPVPA